MKNSIFPILLGFTALLIAFCSAFFSVYGISNLFSGAFISVVIMASSLEIGKLVGTTFLYRYWNKTHKAIKSYLMIAIVLLMLITSSGIFGYLSSAYQQSSLKYKAEESRITMVESSRDYLTNRIAQSKIRIDTLNGVRAMQENRLNTSLTNDFLTRNPVQLRLLQEQTTDLIKSADDNIKLEQSNISSNQFSIMELNNQILEIKQSSNSQKDIKTFQFVADELNVPLDTVAKWFIFIIVLIFDPLAVILILAYNITKSKPNELPISIVTPEIVPVAPIEAVPVQQSISSTTPKSAEPNIPSELSTVPIPSPSPELHPIPDEVKRMFKAAQ